MAESALEKLMRLKKERAGEASAVGGADSSVKQETPKEEIKDANPGSNPIPAGDNSSVDNKDLVEQKPMSAMERLRAIKVGISTPATPAAKTGIVTTEEEKKDVQSSSNQLAPSDDSGGVYNSGNKTSIEVVEEPKTQKERKTHPLAMEMAELEAALDAEVPGFVSILSTIHKKLKADPNCVTLLDDEEIGVIVAGLEKHTNVTIVSPNAVKAAKKASKVPITAADL